DPMPAFNSELAPQEIQQQTTPFQTQPAPQSPRTNLRPMLAALGVTWLTNRIAWDSYNPHPQLKSLPKEFVFVGKGFNQREAITAGLQEMVLLYPGALKARSDAAGQVTSLLETSGESGTVRWEDLVQRNLFGGVVINQGIKHAPEEAKQVLA